MNGEASRPALWFTLLTQPVGRRDPEQTRSVRRKSGREFAGELTEIQLKPQVAHPAPFGQLDRNRRLYLARIEHSHIADA